MTIQATNPIEFDTSAAVRLPLVKLTESSRRVPEEKPKSEPKEKAQDPEILKTVLAEANISLNFKRDDRTGRIVVEMIDNSTGDPVRQIPNEVSLRLSAMFSKVQGQLFEARA